MNKKENAGTPNVMLERLLNGLFKENPTFVLLLGMCPTLAVTTSAINGLGMGLTTLVVLALSNLMISALRNIIPNKIRIPAFIVIIASFVTIVQLLLQAYIPSLYDALGLYIPLIVVNCIILGRAEAYAYSHAPIPSLFDGIGMGLGFSMALTIIGGIRELIGAGQLFGFAVMPSGYIPVSIFVMAPGAFFVLAILTAIQNAIKISGEKKGKDMSKIQSGCGGNCLECDKECKKEEVKPTSSKADENKKSQNSVKSVKDTKTEDIKAKEKELVSAESKNEKAETKALIDAEVKNEVKAEEIVKAEAKAEVKATDKSEVKAEIKDDAIAEAKEEVTKEVKTEAKAEVSEAVKSDEKADVKIDEPVQKTDDKKSDEKIAENSKVGSIFGFLKKKDIKEESIKPKEADIIANASVKAEETKNTESLSKPKSDEKVKDSIIPDDVNDILKEIDKEKEENRKATEEDALKIETDAVDAASEELWDDDTILLLEGDDGLEFFDFDELKNAEIKKEETRSKKPDKRKSAARNAKAQKLLMKAEETIKEDNK